MNFAITLTVAFTLGIVAYAIGYAIGGEPVGQLLAVPVAGIALIPVVTGKGS